MRNVIRGVPRTHHFWLLCLSFLCPPKGWLTLDHWFVWWRMKRTHFRIIRRSQLLKTVRVFSEMGIFEISFCFIQLFRKCVWKEWCTVQNFNLVGREPLFQFSALQSFVNINIGEVKDDHFEKFSVLGIFHQPLFFRMKFPKIEIPFSPI